MNSERHLFLSLTSVLAGFGVLMVHSASITSRPTEFEQIYLSRHLIHLGVGILTAALCAMVPADRWRKASQWLFLVTLVLVVLVLVPGIGTRVNGAQRWLRLGSFQMQPSELAKLALPLLLGAMVIRRREQLHRWFAGTIPFVIPIALTLPLVLKQPDLGTAAFLALSSGMLLFLAGWPMRNFAMGMIPLAGVALTLKPYQWQRINDFIATWSDIDRASYHVKQSLLSLGSGGLMGTGLGKGWLKLSFLPEANTDFVFAVVGEELGLVGSLGLLLLWSGFFITGLQLFRHHDRQSFEFLVGVTLLSQMVLQAAINVAVVTSMMPTKGISHPLLSYGGSNLVINLASIGIVLSLAKSKSSTDDTTSKQSIITDHRPEPHFVAAAADRHAESSTVSD